MILEAIAAIKIANEAIDQVKKLAGHISSIGEMGPQLTKLADAKVEIQKKAGQGDSEAFWALEDIKRKETEIKNLMVYGGRAGLWDDYQRFMETRKTLRENEAKRKELVAKNRKKAIKNAFVYTAVGIGCLIFVGLAVAFMFWMISLKG